MGITDASKGRCDCIGATLHDGTELAGLALALARIGSPLAAVRRGGMGSVRRRLWEVYAGRAASVGPRSVYCQLTCSSVGGVFVYTEAACSFTLTHDKQRRRTCGRARICPPGGRSLSRRPGPVPSRSAWGWCARICPRPALGLSRLGLVRESSPRSALMPSRPNLPT